MPKVLVAAFYKFAALADFADLQEPIQACCRDNGVMGTILLAGEGINGTVAGPDAGVRALLKFLRADARLQDLEHKESRADENPFHRMKVRLKKEIVTMGVAEISPVRQTGQYVEPQDWNALMDDRQVLVIDTRNDYEVSIGTFSGAIDPGTTSFREFPAWLRAQKDLHKKTKVAMFCTGGIRCEKATSLLKAEGFEEVFHLKGGILKYLETVPEKDSRWQGECFVFDQRVSVGHGLKQGGYDLCHACRHPITEADKQLDSYVAGVSCRLCHDRLSGEQKQRFAERQRQIELAKERGQVHIAANQQAQRAQKRAARKLQIEQSRRHDV